MRPSEPIYDEAFRRSTLSANPIWLNRDATRPRTVAECPEWAKLRSTHSKHPLPICPQQQTCVAEGDAKPLRTAFGQIAFGFFEIIAVVGSDGMSGKAAVAMPRPCYVGRAAPSIGLLSALRYGHDGDLRIGTARARRRHDRRLHALRQMRRSLPGD